MDFKSNTTFEINGYLLKDDECLVNLQVLKFLIREQYALDLSDFYLTH